MVAKVWGWETKELVLNGWKVSIWKDEKSSSNGQWQGLPNNVNVHCITVHFKMVKMTEFITIKKKTIRKCACLTLHRSRYCSLELSWWLSGKESACNTGDADSIPGSGRSPGKRNDNPLWCSCLGNPMDRGAWQATVHGVTKELDVTQQQLNNNCFMTPLSHIHVYFVMK